MSQICKYIAAPNFQVVIPVQAEIQCVDFLRLDFLWRDFYGLIFYGVISTA